jgi:hypothetical protein
MIFFNLQRRDDDVLIALMKPIEEISKILKDDINQTNQTTAKVEPKPVIGKTKSNKTKCTKSANSINPNDTMTDCTVPIDQADVVLPTTLDVNDEEVVEKTGNEGLDDSDQSTSCCNAEVNGLPEDNEQSCTSPFVEEVNGDELLVTDKELNVDVDAEVSKDEIVEVSKSIKDKTETKVLNESNGNITESESGINESIEADDVIVREEIENKKRTEVDVSPSISDRIEIPEESEEMRNNSDGENIGEVTEHDVALLPLNEN